MKYIPVGDDDYTEHIADEDSDGDTYAHMAAVHGKTINDNRDPVEAHMEAHEDEA